MNRYLVRTNCEYSLLVVARDEASAIKEALDVDLGRWHQAWADATAEDEGLASIGEVE